MLWRRSSHNESDLQWFEVDAGCRLLDRAIGEAAIRQQTGVSVVGILRDDTLQPNPDPQFSFRKKDMVAVIGSSAARGLFQERFFAAEPAIGQAA